MTLEGLRRWSWIHKWTSLICTVFMLMLCITGLPLIFHDEIDGLLHERGQGCRRPGRHAAGRISTVCVAMRVASDRRARCRIS